MELLGWLGAARAGAGPGCLLLPSQGEKPESLGKEEEEDWDDARDGGGGRRKNSLGRRDMEGKQRGKDEAADIIFI